jgi:hypothetical protein
VTSHGWQAYVIDQQRLFGFQVPRQSTELRQFANKKYLFTFLGERDKSVSDERNHFALSAQFVSGKLAFRSQIHFGGMNCE